MNRPDVLRALELCGALGLEFDLMETSFFLSRQQIVPAAGGTVTMALWRERMFAAMARNAGNVTDYFNIPTNRVIELGTRVRDLAGMLRAASAGTPSPRQSRRERWPLFGRVRHGCT